jgi:deazaflavin-dependent oxidoreductase (nitroreductase family)
MGLPEDLGIVVRPPGPLARFIAVTASTRGGAWVYARTLHHVDRGVRAATRDRFVLSEALGQLPTVWLTTTGARSGQSRTVPLVGVPDGEQLALIGSNFGGRHHPGWVHNLLADPRATVSREGRSVAVRAQEAQAGDVERIWARARTIYRGYDLYAARTAARTDGRTIRVFVLHPDPAGRP